MREFSLGAYFSSWQSATRYNLASSESEPMALAELLDTADSEDRHLWETVKFGYSDPRGRSALREAIAETYSSVSAADIVCFTGAQEAIFTSMHALLSADDHAIIFTPGYQSAETVPLSICSVTGVALDPGRNWALDIDLVRAAIRPNTKMISINFPNNPTGKIIDRATFDELVELCRHHGIWLFSDEVYRLIERRPDQRLPNVVDRYERGISVGGLSKSYGLPGLRLGWLASHDREFLRRVEQSKHFLSVCNSFPCEVLAQIALKSANPILERNRQIASDNLTELTAFFASHEDLFAWQEPDGGVIGFPRYLGTEGVDALCTRLIQDHGILLLPARIFHSDLTRTPDDHFRIGFGRKDFSPALEAMAAVIKDAQRFERRMAVQ